MHLFTGGQLQAVFAFFFDNLYHLLNIIPGYGKLIWKPPLLIFYQIQIILIRRLINIKRKKQYLKAKSLRLFLL